MGGRLRPSWAGVVARKRSARDWQRLDASVQRAIERGDSANDALKAYRARSRAAGGSGVRRQTFLDRYELVRLRLQGVDTSRMPPRRGAGSSTPLRAPMRSKNPRRRGLYMYWMTLVIAEPDGTERDQYYDVASRRKMTDRQAVDKGIMEWNALTRGSPVGGSLTGTAIGGVITNIARIE